MKSGTLTLATQAAWLQSWLDETFTPESEVIPHALADDFDDANDTSLDDKALDSSPAGQNWHILYGVWKTEDGRAICETDNHAWNLVGADAGTGDGEMTCTINRANSADIALATHITDAGNFWMIYLEESGVFNLYEVIDGDVGTAVANGSFASDGEADYDVVLTVNGTTVTANIQATGGDGSDNVEVSYGAFGTSLTATKWGLAARESSGNPQFANFAVTIA